MNTSSAGEWQLTAVYLPSPVLAAVYILLHSRKKFDELENLYAAEIATIFSLGAAREGWIEKKRSAVAGRTISR